MPVYLSLHILYLSIYLKLILLFLPLFLFYTCVVPSTLLFFLELYLFFLSIYLSSYLSSFLSIFNSIFLSVLLFLFYVPIQLILFPPKDLSNLYYTGRPKGTLGYQYPGQFSRPPSSIGPNSVVFGSGVNVDDPDLIRHPLYAKVRILSYM